MRLLLFVCAPIWLGGSWIGLQFHEDERNGEPRDVNVAESEPSSDLKAPLRLMTDEREDRFRSLLPSVDSPRLQQVLNDPNTLLYTTREIPKAYQQWDGALPGVHAVSYNISADNAEPFGNGNLEFPWRGPAGTHETNGVESFKFLALPKDEQGKRLPIAWYKRRFKGDDQQGYAWVFPTGTIVGECLVMKTPDDDLVAFELRIRERTRYDWEVDVFRPFPRDRDLLERLIELRPNWQSEESLAVLIEHLRSQDRLQSDRLVDDHPTPTFIQTMGTDTLPPIDDPELVMELLTTTQFRSSHSMTWASNSDDIFTAAPTTDAEFHVVPAGFLGGFVEVDETSCIRCHETVGKHVRNFERGRDWYGRIRGSDGIFSFHPFSKSSISYNGMGNPVSINSELEEAGWIERFDPEKHPNDRYRRLSFLGE